MLSPTNMTMGSMWAEGSITVDDFLWQAGDYVVIKNYTEETILESAPEPTETITLVDGNTTVRHVVSGDVISFNYWNGGGLSGEISVSISRPIREMIEYVVDDSRNAYPDGAVHTDGYWYERVDKEGLFVWEKRDLNYENEIFLSGEATNGVYTQGSQDGSYVWNEGDFFVFNTNAVGNGYYIITSAPNPRDDLVFTINGVTYTITHTAFGDFSIEADIESSFNFSFSSSIGAGDFISYILDDNESTYPNNGIYPEGDYYSGYWYKSFDTIVEDTMKTYIEEVLNKTY